MTNSQPFVLHPRLVKATEPLGDLPLSRVLMLDDQNYRWLLLVPRQMGVEEIIDLSSADRARLIEELASAEEVLRKLYKPFRFNIADIGNKAEQLHVHLVARSTDDTYWPKVVWSRGMNNFDSDEMKKQIAGEMRAAFSKHCPDFEPLTEHVDPAVDKL